MGTQEEVKELELRERKTCWLVSGGENNCLYRGERKEMRIGTGGGGGDGRKENMLVEVEMDEEEIYLRDRRENIVENKYT